MKMGKFLWLSVMLVLIVSWAAAQSIEVTRPGAGETWFKGTTHEILWTRAGSQDLRVKIRLYDSTATGKVLDIVDDTANDGQYSWTVPPAVSQGSYVIRVKTLNNLVYDDSGIFSIRDNPGLPDLYIQGRVGISPTHPRIGDEVMVSAQIKNSEQTSSGPTRAKLVITGPEGFHKLTRYFNIPALGFQGTLSLRYRHIFLKMGAYRATVTVDDNRIVPEKHEDNNEKFRVFPVHPLPDLMVYLPPVKDVHLGKKRTVTVEVKNLGPGKSGPTTLNFYLEGEGNKEYPIGSLSPDEKRIFRRSHRYWLTGRKRYWARIDPLNKLREWKADNNMGSGSFMVYAGSHFDEGGFESPHRCLSLSFSHPSKLKINEKGAIVVIARNQSSGKSVPVKMEFIVQGHKTTVWAIGELFPGQTREIPYPVKWSSPGTKEFSARIISSDQCRQVKGSLRVE